MPASRDETERAAADVLSAARAILVLSRDPDTIFFATLVMKLAGSRSLPCWDIRTAATDGQSLFYNPDFVMSLVTASGKYDQVIFVLAHEVLHCANAHFARRGDREPKKANVAMDLAINQLLRLSRIGSPPPGTLFHDQPPFKKLKLPAMQAFEDYYFLLPDLPKGLDDDDPGGCGGIIDAPDDASAKEADEDWKIQVGQAAEVARGRGKLSGHLSKIIDTFMDPAVDWAQELRHFVTQFAKNDYSWAMPSRRHLAQQIYLPGMHSEELGTVVLMVDCSGSCWSAPTLLRFASEIQGILDIFACELTILYHDVKVHDVVTWKSSDGPLVLTPQGGGGTSHGPAFDWVDQHMPDVACVIALTDLDTEFPHEPDYPVLWCSVGNATAPWGRVITII